ncbi:MAG TPA: cupredoxin domain-containing protein [Hyphomicrobiaceae bacterium]|jgi:plastocyanin|nr:cupredoxin domain-containing protein [Hyphomicrobiaceae bacterium]
MALWLAALTAGTGASSCAAEAVRVTVDKLTFAPAQISAHVGDTIEWVSTDFLAHTATARNKEWDVVLQPNGSGRVTVKSAGSIEYYCRFHPNMVGRISVSAK